MTALDISPLETWFWEAACSLRGPVDAPKFKDYILPLIFLKRLSDVFDDEVLRVAQDSNVSVSVTPRPHCENPRLITNDEVAANDYNLSPSRYVAQNDVEDVLPLEEAVVRLREAEEARAEADRALTEVLRTLGLLEG